MTSPIKIAARPEAPLPSPADVTAPQGAPALTVRRLNLMRVGYLEMGLGLAVTKWSTLVTRQGHWPLFEGVTTYLLVAMGVLALIGLRHPAKMLPILVFESMWKIAWLTAVALPLWAHHQLDPATTKVAGAVLFGVVVVAVTPWRHVFAQYVKAPGDPWRSSPPTRATDRRDTTLAAASPASP